MRGKDEYELGMWLCCEDGKFHISSPMANCYLVGEMGLHPSNI